MYLKETAGINNNNNNNTMMATSDCGEKSKPVAGKKVGVVTLKREERRL